MSLKTCVLKIFSEIYRFFLKNGVFAVYYSLFPLDFSRIISHFDFFFFNSKGGRKLHEPIKAKKFRFLYLIFFFSLTFLLGLYNGRVHSHACLPKISCLSPKQKVLQHHLLQNLLRKKHKTLFYILKLERNFLSRPSYLLIDCHVRESSILAQPINKKFLKHNLHTTALAGHCS